ncbi:MAG: hypothetical protein AB1553_01775 [Nitrospirota bacterium]
MNGAGIEELKLSGSQSPLLSGIPSGEEPASSPEYFLNTSMVADILLRLAQNESLQTVLIQHFFSDVILQELQRRGIVEPLMDIEDLAKTLNLTTEGIYKKIQNEELGIPFINKGRWGGYKFDPKDVREAIRKAKVHPIVRPASLKRVRVGRHG